MQAEAARNPAVHGFRRPFTHVVELIRFAFYGQIAWNALAVVVGCLALFLAGAILAYDPSRGLAARRDGVGGTA